MWESAWQQRPLGNPWRQNLVTQVSVRLFIHNISEFLIGWNPMLIFQNWLKLLALRITSFKEFRGNFACEIRNPFVCWMRIQLEEYGIHSVCPRTFGIRNPAESTAYNREFNTVLDSLTWGNWEDEPNWKIFPDIIACENIHFSSLFAAGDVSRETSPAAKSEEKRMFSQTTDISAIDVNRTGTILGYAKTK